MLDSQSAAVVGGPGRRPASTRSRSRSPTVADGRARRRRARDGRHHHARSTARGRHAPTRCRGHLERCRRARRSRSSIERDGTPKTGHDHHRAVPRRSVEVADRGQLGQDFDPPFDVNINLGQEIGGPSAGMMFSLAIYDKITPGALTGGTHIAGTGTIDVDGNVGEIGGIQQKIAGAYDAGRPVFLVPAGQLRRGRRRPRRGRGRADQGQHARRRGQRPRGARRRRRRRRSRCGAADARWPRDDRASATRRAAPTSRWALRLAVVEVERHVERRAGGTSPAGCSRWSRPPSWSRPSPSWPSSSGSATARPIVSPRSSRNSTNIRRVGGAAGPDQLAADRSSVRGGGRASRAAARGGGRRARRPRRGGRRSLPSTPIARTSGSLSACCARARRTASLRMRSHDDDDAPGARRRPRARPGLERCVRRLSRARPRSPRGRIQRLRSPEE